MCIIYALHRKFSERFTKAKLLFSSLACHPSFRRVLKISCSSLSFILGRGGVLTMSFWPFRLPFLAVYE